MLLLLLALIAAPPEPQIVRFPHVAADLDRRRVLVEAEQVVVDAPLEFVAVVAGTADHETVVRTRARPSDIHAALLLLGLEPGQPVRWGEAAGAFLPPEGPPLRIGVEWAGEGGEAVSVPVERLIRDLDTGAPMPPRTWVFAGSRLTDRGRYEADATGQIASLVNFDSTVIDVPYLASDANETLDWELNPENAPPAGTPVTLVLEPVGDAPATRPTTGPATRPDAEDAAPPDASTDLDPVDVAALKRQWQAAVAPQRAALGEAARTHYDVIRELRRRQQHLITEADRLQRVIDELEANYQDLVTPRPREVGSRE